MYKAYKAVYERPCCMVRVNRELTQSFDNLYGVRQGDNSSPTLFNCYINPLLKELENQNVGVRLKYEYSTVTGEVFEGGGDDEGGALGLWVWLVDRLERCQSHQVVGALPMGRVSGGWELGAWGSEWTGGSLDSSRSAAASDT